MTKKAGYVAAISLLLAAAANGADPANPLSFGDGKVVFDVEERARLETRQNNFDFNDAKNSLGDVTDDTFLLQRFRIGVTVRPSESIGGYLQGQDTRQIWATRPGVPYTFGSEGDDPFDLRQAYIDLGNLAACPFTMRLGRQELSYGDERLVGSAGWNNFSRTFDALKLRYSDPNRLLTLDAFGAHVVNIAGFGPDANDGMIFNTADWDDTLVGLYLSTKALEFQTTDLYVLFRDKGDSDPVYTAMSGTLTNRATPYDIAQRIWTLGFRIQSTPGKTGNWDYDAEVAYQTGRSAGQQGAAVPGPEMIDHEAFAIHAGAGYSWAKIAWSPRLGVEYNVASGDKNPDDNNDQSFLNLFPSNHKPYGRMDLFSWKNIHDLACGLRLTPYQDAQQPSHKLVLDVDGHAFWLYSNQDAWCRANGVARVRPLNAAALSANRFVGSELDVTISYNTPWKWLRVDTGYSHFFAGGYVSDTANAVTGAGGDDADFGYVQTTMTF